MSSKSKDDEAKRLEEVRKAKIARTLSVAAGMLMTSVTMCVPTRAPLILKIKKGDAAATAKAMGLMSMCAALIELFVNPVLGKLSDQYGRKPFMIFTPIISALCHMLVVVSPENLSMQFLDRMISGSMIFGFAAPSQAAMADLYAKDPQKYGMMAAKTGAYFGFGCALGPFLGAKIGGAKSFFASALGFVITSLYVNMQMTETLPMSARKPFRFSDINPVAFLKLFQTPKLAWLSITTALQSFGDYANIYDINNLFMIKVLGYGQGQIGTFATGVGVSQIAGGMVTASVIKNTSLKTTTALSNVLWMVGMALMGTSRNSPQAFCALMIWTFGHQRATPVDSYLQKYGAARSLGRAEILAAKTNLSAYLKVIIPLLYSNIFAWSTSNGRNIPGSPYFTICAITALAQAAFWKAAPED